MELANEPINYAKRALIPEELFSELEGVCKKYIGSDKDNAQVVKFKDILMESMKKHKYCLAQKLNVKQVGCHPCNRDTEGLSDTRASTRLKVIKKGGMSFATIRPNCVTMEDNPNTHHIAKFTCDQVSKSDKYGQYERDQIKAGTLGAGHATHGFVQLLDEVPCDIEEISEHGRMSKSKCYEDAGIKQACEEGLEYDVIDHRIETVFPIIPTIISSGLNTVTQVASGENWHSMLLKIVNEIGKHWPVTDWKQIKKNVLRSQPPRPQDVSDMVDYIAKWGGLPSGMLIKELSELSNLFVDPERVVSGQFFKHLAELAVPPSKVPGDFVNAVVFVHAKSDVNVQDGIARYISKGDVADLVKTTAKLDRVMCANVMIGRFRKTLAAADITPRQRLQLMSRVKEAIVESTMQRKSRAEKRDLDAVAKDFATEIADAARGDHGLGAPSASTTVESDPVSRVVTYTDDGAASAVGRTVVAMRGFSAGDFVKKRKESNWCQFQIKAIADNGDVDLNPVDRHDGVVKHDELVTVARDKFMTEWHETAAKIEVVTNYPGNDAAKSKALPEYTMKKTIATCVQPLVKQYPAPSVRIFSAPEKTVIALSDYDDAGSLVLVPATMNVGAKDPKAVPLLRAVEATVGGAPSGFLLLPYSSKEFDSPMWHVKLLHDREECNLELVPKDVYAKPASTKDRSTNPALVVGVPCAVNFVPIKKNTELLLFRPKPSVPSKPKREAPVQLSTASDKKARTSV